MERGYSDNREQDSDYESDCGTSIPGLSIENDFGVGSLLPIATKMMEIYERKVMYNGINLLTLGGRDDNEKARRIARKLWTIEELRKIVIDNTRRSGTRKAAVHIELSCSEMQ